MLTRLFPQDVLWVGVKAKEIEKLRMRVYSVPVDQQERAYASFQTPVGAVRCAVPTLMDRRQSPVQSYALFWGKKLNNK